MEIIEKIWNTNGTMHHAHILVGFDVQVVVDFLEKKVNLRTAGNPDFWHRKYDILTIDNARELAMAQEAKNFIENGRKIFLIETNGITEQAQNALLKVFEEPTKDTHFFILIPQDTLLPTLRSRVFLISENPNENNNSKKNISIRKISLDMRLAMVKKIVDGIKDDEKTKQDAIDFVNQIERELYDGGVENNFSGLKLCQLSRDSLLDNGAPVKMILENLVIAI